MLNLIQTKTSRFIKSFKTETKGNVAMMFAGSAVAIIAAAGLAIDGSNIRKAKMELQATVDSASLAIAKDQLNNQTDRDATANAYLDTQSNLGAITLNEASAIGAAYKVDATMNYKTSFMQVFGYKTVPVRAASTTVYEVRDINISLVLDTTGSMGGAKLASLKVAANNLVSSLEAVPGNAVKIAVVPFAQHVNVGVANQSASFMNVSTGGWAGCVGSRNGALASDAAHGGNDFPGIAGTDCATPLLPLTNNMNSVRASINGLTASGWTYIPAGMAWGWRTLSPSEPFTQISSSNGPSAEKIMIVMTDGANTRSKNGVGHYGWDQTTANTATTVQCGKVKGDNITVYTIAYEITDVTTQNLMESCASSTSNYFQADNATQLGNAFSQISASIQTLRLTN